MLCSGKLTVHPNSGLLMPSGDPALTAWCPSRASWGRHRPGAVRPSALAPELAPRLTRRPVSSGSFPGLCWWGSSLEAPPPPGVSLMSLRTSLTSICASLLTMSTLSPGHLPPWRDGSGESLGRWGGPCGVASQPHTRPSMGRPGAHSPRDQPAQALVVEKHRCKVRDEHKEEKEITS